MTPEETAILRDHQVLRVIVGSTAYGLSHSGSDIDRLAVAVLPTECILGLREYPQTDVQHEPYDMQTHEVGKFVRLALKCNPTILESLFLEAQFVEDMTWVGSDLNYLRDKFLSRGHVKNAYTGYAREQLHRLQNRGWQRREKHARHVWRLMYQGLQLLETGKMNVTLTPVEASLCREFSQLENNAMLRAFSLMEERLELAAQNTSLPEKPDTDAINNWLINVRKEFL